MTCKDCIHYNVCEGNFDLTFASGGAQECYHFVTEFDYVKGFFKRNIERLQASKSNFVYADTDSIKISKENRC